MAQPSVPDNLLRHAGLVLAHAAAIASALKPGELICPFAVLTKGENRQSIEFEASSQEAAVSLAWDSLEQYKEHFELWAMAREGLSAGNDVIVVAAWAHGMVEPAIFSQRFRPSGSGGFALIGPIMANELPENELGRIGSLISSGIAKHPKGANWSSWHLE